MSDVDSIDFFRSGSVLRDPYPYFEELRSQCPVHREPHEGVVMVTGYDEALSVFRDVQTFSSCNSVTGPFPGLSVPLEGEDVTDLIEQHRDELPFSDQLPTFDPPKHTDAPRPHVATADAEADDGERAVHLATGGSPDRRVHRPR